MKLRHIRNDQIDHSQKHFNLWEGEADIVGGCLIDYSHTAAKKKKKHKLNKK